MFLVKYEKRIYVILRFVAGFLFLWHGSQKMFDFPAAGFVPPAYILWIAGPIEFLGGLMIMFGLFTRWAAFIASGEMAYAYWSAHGTIALLPLVNRGELAMLYCFLFLFIAAKGSGACAIDNLICKKKPE
jgi:putative oxidoreductase